MEKRNVCCWEKTGVESRYEWCKLRNFDIWNRGRPPLTKWSKLPEPSATSLDSGTDTIENRRDKTSRARRHSLQM